jgi:hypothetical protein
MFQQRPGVEDISDVIERKRDVERRRRGVTEGRESGRGWSSAQSGIPSRVQRTAAAFPESQWQSRRFSKAVTVTGQCFLRLIFIRSEQGLWHTQVF